MSLALMLRSHKLLACCAFALVLLAIGAARESEASAYARFQANPAAALPARIADGAEVRSGPGEHYLVLTVARPGERHPLLGRSRDGEWWRIDFRGQPAWVASTQVETQVTDVPVVRVGGEPL